MRSKEWFCCKSFFPIDSFFIFESISIWLIISKSNQYGFYKNVRLIKIKRIRKECKKNQQISLHIKKYAKRLPKRFHHRWFNVRQSEPFTITQPVTQWIKVRFQSIEDSKLAWKNQDAGSDWKWKYIEKNEYRISE